MADSCIKPGWRWRAVRDIFTEQPRLVALGAVGAVLLTIGVAVESAALGAAGILGAGLLAGSMIFPTISKLSIGTYFGIEKADGAGREEQIAELMERLGPTLVDLAGRIDPSAKTESRQAWARQALAQAYHDIELVPRSEGEVHALCLLVRRVRAAVGREIVVGGARVQFEDRAAWALLELGYDPETAAAVLHRGPGETDVGSQGGKPISPSGGQSR